jgi:anti-anti-sigma regulatory factor
MDIGFRHVQGNVPVTILKLDGELDAVCYVDVIVEAKNLYDRGTRDLLIDLSDLRFMASSGLVSLHSIALIMRGEQPPDPGASWSTFRTDHFQLGTESHYEEHCKLLNPRTRISRTLELAGFSEVFEVFTDEEQAVESFG